jgi:hypothetical protein
MFVWQSIKLYAWALSCTHISKCDAPTPTNATDVINSWYRTIPCSITARSKRNVHRGAILRLLDTKAGGAWKCESQKKGESRERSPRSVAKPGVTCSGMGRMSCERSTLKHTSWYFVYETTAEPCFDQDRQPGATSSSLCRTTENCQHNTTENISNQITLYPGPRCHPNICPGRLGETSKSKKYDLRGRTSLPRRSGTTRSRPFNLCNTISAYWQTYLIALLQEQ